MRTYFYKVAFLKDKGSMDEFWARLPEDLITSAVVEDYSELKESLSEAPEAMPDDYACGEGVVKCSFFTEDYESACRLAGRISGAGISGEHKIEKVETGQFPRFIDIGEKYCVVFFENLSDYNGDRRPVAISSTQIFGTGDHPTTRLMVEAIEDEDVAGMKVIDAGAGSCVLTAVALFEGALCADAFDVETGFKAIASQMMDVNGIDFYAVEGDQHVYSRLRGPQIAAADLLMINMLPRYAMPVASGLLPLLKDGAVVMISGIPADHLRESEIFYAGAGLEVTKTRRLDDWYMLRTVKNILK